MVADWCSDSNRNGLAKCGGSQRVKEINNLEYQIRNKSCDFHRKRNIDRGHAAGARSWLRHCATSRKVAGSIPGGVIGIFH